MSLTRREEVNLYDSIQKSFPKILIKDLTEHERICPVCNGLGMKIENNIYGIKGDDSEAGRREHFPYKHQALSFCQSCFNGVQSLCPYCGQPYKNQGYMHCDCEGQKKADEEERVKKWNEKVSKAIPVGEKDVDTMLYCEEFDEYYSTVDDFFEDYAANYMDEELYIRPERLWVCDVEKIHIDADNVVEHACEDLHEDAYEQCDIGGLQDMLDGWCKEQTGSKRSQAEKILTFFPKEIDTYYEPFCGGASVLRRLLDSDIKVNRYICSDLNGGLIDLWNKIINYPSDVSSYYKELWNELNVDDDKQRKKEYFAKVRERYNKEHNPLDFMFIMRTTTNGMPRYNRDGNFNNSFHVTRDGIIPETLDNIIHEWSHLLKKNNVEFVSCSYEDIKPTENDFMYLDPPYANTKGMYYGTIDYEKFWNYLRGLPCKYALSFDGKSGDVDNTWNVPEDIYTRHEYLLSGNSSFKRTIGKSNDSIVYESLYVKG